MVPRLISDRKELSRSALHNENTEAFVLFLALANRARLPCSVDALSRDRYRGLRNQDHVVLIALCLERSLPLLTNARTLCS